MNTPTPPTGYKLVKGEDIKDRVPEGALIWSSSQCLDDEPEWVTSGRIGGQLYGFEVKTFYAIPEINPKTSLSDEAKTIVAGDRAQDYGDATESFKRIAALWTAWKGVEFTPWDVAQMMILLKVSRAKTSRKRDTLVDIIGYAECAEKVGEVLL